MERERDESSRSISNFTDTRLWQSNTAYDRVHYDHTDSSGMSQRKTRSAPETVLGVPSYDPGYIDSRHAEFDAGGTNVGLVTNYNPPPGDPPENFAPLEDTSPLWINGQRVTATLDGMAISWQMVRNLLDHGAAVPVGIDNILRAARGRDINLQYTGSGRYTFRDFTSTYDGPGSRYIGVTFDFSFNFGTQQTQQPQRVTFRNNTDARAALSETLAKGDCAKQLQKLFENSKQLNPNAQFANPVRNTDALNLFDDLAGQQKGGFLFD